MRVTSIRIAPGSGVVVHFQVGTVAAAGFDPDPLIPELQRQLVKAEAEAVRERAMLAGAPTTEGEQEARFADLLAHLDVEGWEPKRLRRPPPPPEADPEPCPFCGADISGPPDSSGYQTCVRGCRWHAVNAFAGTDGNPA